MTERRSKYNVDLSPAGKAERTYNGHLYDSLAETAMDRASLLHKGPVVIVIPDSKTKGDHGEPE